MSEFIENERAGGSSGVHTSGVPLKKGVSEIEMEIGESEGAWSSEREEGSDLDSN